MHVTVIPDLHLERLTYRPFRNRIQLQPYFGTFAITLASMLPHANGRMVKSLIDFVASGIGLIVVAPLFAVIALAIKISSPGPVFYKQERSGLNGRTFMLYKFRTMVADADRKRKEEDKPRRTAATAQYLPRGDEPRGSPPADSGGGCAVQAVAEKAPVHEAGFDMYLADIAKPQRYIF
ncbi:MAG: sugar transferase [Deltaproteobacteria bacterium]|nr:sugar transferase [Deltaproteobacteria bacterium]